MPQPIQEHDMVVLLSDLPEETLSAGEIGAVVFVHKNGEAYEVEFEAARGNGMGGVVTVMADKLLRLNNVRRLARS